MRPYGDRAVLVELGGTDEVVAYARAVRAADVEGVADVVPGARTVLVVARTPRDLARVRQALAEMDPEPTAERTSADVVELPVVYDGPDLHEVARFTGLTADEVVAAHTGTPWTVAFGGFAPGFAYLAGGDPRLHVPRRDEPRPRVPAGSVGLAGELSGVYPRESPGGWQLLGRTDAHLWDLDRDPPALLRPGAAVRFVAVDALGDVPSTDAPSTGSATGAGVRVLATGPRTTVQDAGRPGLAGLGVGPSGAADRAAHALADRLLANSEDSATLEVTLGGLRLRAEGRDVLLVVTGADVDVLVDGRGQGLNAPFLLRDGQELTLGTARAGLRAYVGVRGGWDVPAVLGSRATDALAGLGPAPLVAGDLLPVGPAPDGLPVVDVAPVAPPTTGDVVLHLVRGPRDDWLADADTLTATTWVIGARSDRVGLRLEPAQGASPVVHTEPGRQLPSEGLVRGAVQVPPGGEPVVVLADHPVTGGYPVGGVVVDRDLDAAAQLRPGQRVTLRWASA